MNVHMGPHTFAGEYQSAIKKAKRLLLAAGFSWSKTTGRYHPFANQQKTTRGMSVTRIGCSETIALHYRGAVLGGETDRQETRWAEALAIATLREGGMPFDDRGWLACGADGAKARKAMEKEALNVPVAIVLDVLRVQDQPTRLLVHGLSTHAGRARTLAGLQQLRDLVVARHTLALQVFSDPDVFRLALCAIGQRPLGDAELEQLTRLVKEAAEELGIKRA